MDIKKILVVDDELHMRELLKYHLVKNGFEVRTGGNGQEGLDLVKMEKPDLIISDVMMPKVDGYEFCRRMREDKETKTVPFIFLTAKGQLPDKIQGLKTGADDYIVKPFNPEELIHVVKARSHRVDVYLEAANLDELTGIFNNRYMKERMKEDLDQASRTGSIVSVCFIDIDRFSRINDELGHQGGDLALKRVVQLIKENVRNSDLLARYGGEEFLVLMPDTKVQEAEAAMERVRSAVENEKFMAEGKELNIKVTVSIGISTFPKDGSIEQELIEKADKALYVAKGEGRNRVVIYEKKESTGS